MQPQHAPHILPQFASDYFGDSRVSSILFIKYQQACLDTAVAELMPSKKATALSSNLFQESSFKTNEAQKFQYWFDWYCKYSFLNCMNHYSYLYVKIS
jgi:hypothetical protein